MTTAREIMSTDVEFIAPDTSIVDAARRMAQTDVGALPVCNDDKRLHGMLTYRDIVVQVIAQGQDPSRCTVRDVVQGTEVVTIGADDPVEEAIRTMKDHKVRRLPVIDGNEVVGMISQGDLATSVSDDKVGDLVEAISAAP